jgi:hypothetical protein
MSVHKQGADTPNDLSGPASFNGAHHVVLMVEDYQNARPGLKEVLRLKGYRVIDADNGRMRPGRLVRPIRISWLWTWTYHCFTG